MSALPSALARKAASPQWFPILTRYRFEKKVAGSLSALGIESFLPLLRQSHRWSDRQKSIQTPLFPGYVFAQICWSPIERLQVLQTQGVIRFVNFGRDVVTVPAKQIEDLQKLLANNVPCTLHAFIKVGRRVRIRGGCLDGLEGILESSRQKQLVVSVEGIERAVAVRIEGYELELV
jgi:transcriptional antiterminator RfaH